MSEKPKLTQRAKNFLDDIIVSLIGKRDIHIRNPPKTPYNEMESYMGEVQWISGELYERRTSGEGIFEMSTETERDKEFFTEEELQFGSYYDSAYHKLRGLLRDYTPKNDRSEDCKKSTLSINSFRLGRKVLLVAKVKSKYETGTEVVDFFGRPMLGPATLYIWKDKLKLRGFYTP